jgi:hypothetical protein
VHEATSLKFNGVRSREELPVIPAAEGHSGFYATLIVVAPSWAVLSRQKTNCVMLSAYKPMKDRVGKKITH